MYYSGHGVASGGENFIVPVDVGGSVQPAHESGRRAPERNCQDPARYRLRRRRTIWSSMPAATISVVRAAARGSCRCARKADCWLPSRRHPGQVATDLGDGGGPYAKALATEIVKPAISDSVDVPPRENRGERTPPTAIRSPGRSMASADGSASTSEAAHDNRSRHRL